jgi:hypothetical protein
VKLDSAHMKHERAPPPSSSSSSFFPVFKGSTGRSESSGFFSRKSEERGKQLSQPIQTFKRQSPSFPLQPSSRIVDNISSSGNIKDTGFFGSTSTQSTIGMKRPVPYQPHMSFTESSDSEAFAELHEITQSPLDVNEYPSADTIDRETPTLREGRVPTPKQSFTQMESKSSQADRQKILISKDELEMKKLMKNWITEKKLELTDLLYEAEVTATNDQDTLNAIGLKSMIALLCSKGQDYSETNFRNEMQKMGCNDAIAVNKILDCLQDWRLKVIEEHDGDN